MNKLVLVLTLAAVAAAGCGSENTSQPDSTLTSQPTSAAVSDINPDDFQATVDNPFFPLPASAVFVLEGEESDPETGETVQVRSEATVLPDTTVVAGVEVTVVEDKVFEDGQLVESTLDYYAQHRDGSVYYFGERVDDYEDGQVVGHSGEWLAGEGNNLPGIFMPADPQLGAAFEQERAPGIAEDRSTVIAVDQSLTTPAGSFTGCIKTEDINPLDGLTEHKYYCPGAGFVREETPPDGHLDLMSY